MKKILIINGAPRSGKDTFNEIVSYISKVPVFTSSWVEKIKIIAPLLGWDGKKDADGRSFLATLADELEDECFDYVTGKSNWLSSCFNDFIYCLHSRRACDINRLKDYYLSKGDDVYTVCIRRDLVEDKEQSNTADSGIFEIEYDYYIGNSYGLGEFYDNIKNFYEEVLYESDNT